MATDFFLDSPVPPKLDLTGARSQFYRPPRTPSATSSLCRSVASSAHLSSRKRFRFGYGDVDSHQTLGSPDSCTGWRGDNSTQLNDPASPAPLVNIDYRLAAGGLESHKAALAPGTTVPGYDDSAELDYRPSRYSLYPLVQEGNKRKRARPESAGRDTRNATESASTTSLGWGRTVMNLVGGVAGKVWDFCWSGAFRGFYAGGGRGYDVNAPFPDEPMTPSLDHSAWEKLSQIDDSMRRNPFVSRDLNVSPNCPQADNDWVLVKGDREKNENSPSYIPRRVQRRPAPMHHKPGVRITPKRPSLIPVRPSSSLSHKNHTPQRPICSSPLSENRPRTPKESPLVLEAQRQAAKIRRREKEEDASIRRLNQQLKAMIREGKEALGTRVEIDDTMDVDDF